MNYTELGNTLTKWQDAYYNDTDQKVEDSKYDFHLAAFLHQSSLMKPENLHPFYHKWKLGKQAWKGFRKAKHPVPALSVPTIFDSTKLVMFQSHKTIWQDKADGLSLNLIYRNGILSQAITRGNGYEGDDVTTNVKHISNVPLTIPTKETVVVRGEVVVSEKDFLDYAGATEYSTPRSMVQGGLKSHDPKVIQALPIRFEAFTCYTNNVGTEMDAVEYLLVLGFRTYIRTSFEPLVNRNPDIPNDGWVIKVNDRAEQGEFGNSDDHHLWALALKPQGAFAETTVTEVLYEVGKTGQITPRLNFKPIKLNGTTHNYVTAHTCRMLVEEGLGVGAKILVEKKGESIPGILEVTSTVNIDLPDLCPVCDSFLEWSTGDAHLFCKNTKCEGIQQSQLAHFLAIVDVPKFKFASAMKMGYTTISKVLNYLPVVEKVKTMSWSNFLYALSIYGVGNSRSQLLAKFFPSPDYLMDELNKKKPFEDNGFTDSAIDQLRYGFFFPDTQDALKEYANITFEAQKDFSVKKGAFTDMVFCITGELGGYTRDQAHALIKEHGGIVSTSVTKKTTHLLVANSPGKSKMDGAKKNGTKIVDEKWFLEALNLSVPNEVAIL